MDSEDWKKYIYSIGLLLYFDRRKYHWSSSSQSWITAMTVELNWKIVSVSFCFVLFILFLKPIFSKPDQRYFLVDFLWTTWGLFSPYFIRSLASLPPSWPNWPTSARPAAALVHIDSSLKLSNSRPSVSSFPSRKLLRSFGKASDGENRNGEETFGFKIFYL